MSTTCRHSPGLEARGHVARSLGILAAVCLPSASLAAEDVSPWCSALQEATVQIRGDFLLYQGSETTKITDWRGGSGFWTADGVVVTAHHVVDKMDRIEVCGSDGVCRPVTAVAGYPEVDVAVLQVDGGVAPRKLQLGSSGAPGQAVVAAGYPGDVGFVCGPGHVTGKMPNPSPPYLLWEGAVTAEGSSGGPIVRIGKNAKKLEVIGLVSGVTRVGSVWFNRAAPLDVVSGAAPGTAPSAWREAAPWAEERPAQVALAPGRAWWEDLDVPAFQDIELTAATEGLCYGFYRAAPTLDRALEPEPIAWTCDGRPIRYTTQADETVRISLWTQSASGWSGEVSLRLR